MKAYLIGESGLVLVDNFGATFVIALYLSDYVAYLHDRSTHYRRSINLYESNKTINISK